VRLVDGAIAPELQGAYFGNHLTVQCNQERCAVPRLTKKAGHIPAKFPHPNLTRWSRVTLLWFSHGNSECVHIACIQIESRMHATIALASLQNMALNYRMLWQG
jgi:hypothetical protein